MPKEMKLKRLIDALHAWQSDPDASHDETDSERELEDAFDAYNH